jgi:hypothetical protein
MAHYLIPPEVEAEIEKLTGMAFSEAVPVLENLMGASFPVVAPMLVFMAPLINKAVGDLEARVIALEKKTL